jgi:hypothetical protein
MRMISASPFSPSPESVLVTEAVGWTYELVKVGRNRTEWNVVKARTREMGNVGKFY